MMFDETSSITSINQVGEIPADNFPIEKPKDERHNFPPYLLKLNKLAFLREASHLKEVDMMFSANEGYFRDTVVQDLADGILNLINLSNQQNADAVMFMDKSARPAAYLFRKTWQLCFPQSDMPEIRFVNIGKEGGKKYESPEALNELRNAHRNAVANGKVIIADEFVTTGKTLVRAKGILESVFPEAREFIVSNRPSLVL